MKKLIVRPIDLNIHLNVSLLIVILLPFLSSCLSNEEVNQESRNPDSNPATQFYHFVSDSLPISSDSMSYQQKFDSARFYMGKKRFKKSEPLAYESFTEAFAKDDWNYGLAAFSLYGAMLQQKGQYERILQAYPLSILDSAEKYIQPNNHYLCLMHQLIGACYIETGRIRKGLNQFRKIPPVLAKNLPYMRHFVDTVSSELKKSAMISDINVRSLQYHHSMSAGYMYLGEFDSAFIHLDSAEVYTQAYWHPFVVENYNMANETLSMCYDLRGNIYQQMGNWEKALEAHLKSLELIKDSKISLSEKGGLLFNVGICKRMLGEYEEAIPYLEASNEYYRNLFKAHKIPDTSPTLLEIAENHFALGEYKKAMDATNEALFHLSRNIPKDSIAAADLKIEHLPIGIRSLKALSMKAELQATSLEKELAYFEDCISEDENLKVKNSKSLSEALATHQLYQKIHSNMLLNNILSMEDFLGKNDDKFDILKESNQLFERGIKLCKIMIGLDFQARDTYEQLAFDFFEANKQNLLSYGIRMNGIDNFGGLPQNIRDRETLLQGQLNALNGEIFGREQVNEDPQPTQMLREERDSVQAELEQFILELKRKHPNYYQLKYNYLSPKLAEVQERLSTNEAYLEYFWGQDQLFSLLISPDSVKIFSICQSKNLQNEVEKLTWAQRKKSSLLSDQALRDSLVLPSVLLYDSLLRSPIEHLKSVSPNLTFLTLIPDGPLNHLSFDALLTQMPQEPYFYYNMEFLLEDSLLVLSYDYSVSRKIRAERKQQGPTFKVDYNLFSPSYQQTAYPELDFQGKQAKEIKGIFSGKGRAYFWQEKDNQRVTKGLIESKAAYSRINHFLMHGEAIPNNPMASSLILSEGQSLTTADVYNMVMPMDLAILDACESGLGEVLPGEGLLSMSRAWTYAGAEAVFMSKWKVVDKSSVKLIPLFFKYLLEGKRKDQAWKEARLDFLAHGSAQDHAPYYWASISSSGDQSALYQKGPQKRWFFLGGLGLLACILLIRSSRRSSAS